MSQSQSKKSGSIATTNLTRRQAMRGLAGGAAAVGAGSAGIRFGSDDVEAAAPAIGAGIGVGLAAKYVWDRITEDNTGAAAEYEDLDIAQTHHQMYEDVLTWKQQDEAIITNLRNLISGAPNIVIADAKKAAVEELNLGNTTSEAQSAMDNVIDDFYKTQQDNVIDYWINRFHNIKAAQVTKYDLPTIGDDYDETELHSGDYNTWTGALVAADGTEDPQITFGDPDKLDPNATSSENGLEIEFVDGNTQKIPYSDNVTPTINTVSNVNSEDDLEGGFFITDPQTGDTVEFHHTEDWYHLWNEIESQYEEVSSEMETWLNGVADGYQSGDISTSDLISATDLIGDSQEQDGFSFAAAELSTLGISGADMALEIELHDAEMVVDGAIYHQDQSVESLDTGVRYDPGSDIAGTVYLAYEVTNDEGELESDLVSLEQDFTVLAARDSDGDYVDELTFEQRNQQSYSQDYLEVQDELEELRQLQEDINDRQQNIATASGGGGFLDGLDNRNSAVAVVFAAILVAIGVLGD